MMGDGCFGPALQALAIKHALMCPEYTQLLDDLVIGWRGKGFQPRKMVLEHAVTDIRDKWRFHVKEGHPKYLKVLNIDPD